MWCFAHPSQLQLPRRLECDTSPPPAGEWSPTSRTLVSCTWCIFGEFLWLPPSRLAVRRYLEVPCPGRLREHQRAIPKRFLNMYEVEVHMHICTRSKCMQIEPTPGNTHKNKTTPSSRNGVFDVRSTNEYDHVEANRPPTHRVLTRYSRELSAEEWSKVDAQEGFDSSGWSTSGAAHKSILLSLGTP